MTSTGGLLQIPCLSVFDMDIQDDIYYGPTNCNVNYFFECKKDEIPYSSITVFNAHETYLHDNHARIYKNEITKNHG